jgi:hypothetical protein
VGLYIRSGLGFKVIARSSESGVEFFFAVIKLRNRVVFVAIIYYTGHLAQVLFIIRST